MKVFAVIVVLLVVILAYLSYRGTAVQHAGFSFTYRNGDCAVWYSRKGGHVTDVLIVPRTKLGEYLDAGDSIVHTPNGDVPFGTRGMAYVLDGETWSSRAITPFHERHLPNIDSLASSESITEVAERILTRPEQR